jgi:KUP system potassium uptake protein
LLHNIKHNHVLHEQIIILTIRTEGTPSIPIDQRGSVEKLSERFSVLRLRFGFMDQPNVTQALAHMRKSGLKFDIMTTSFYVGRRNIISDPTSGMPGWQDKLFISLAAAAADPSDYFRLPANRVVELGTQVSV